MNRKIPQHLFLLLFFFGVGLANYLFFYFGIFALAKKAASTKK